MTPRDELANDVIARIDQGKVRTMGPLLTAIVANVISTLITCYGEKLLEALLEALKNGKTFRPNLVQRFRLRRMVRKCARSQDVAIGDDIYKALLGYSSSVTPEKVETLLGK